MGCSELQARTGERRSSSPRLCQETAGARGPTWLKAGGTVLAWPLLALMLKRVWLGPGSWGWPWSLIPWVDRTHFGSSLECGVMGWGWNFPLFLKRIISVSWPFFIWNLWLLTLPWFLPHEDGIHIERFPSLWDGQEGKVRTNFLMKSVWVHSTLVLCPSDSPGK